ncbi:MAG TPA: methionyl-tRNA formyltransferase [Candidatus Paceibacterota bacterium]|nr:methionyl-tRNA formyltransferase [Candidatus Paceibacterota bacterium]
MNPTPSNPRFAFFGTPVFSTFVLHELVSNGYVPNLIVTTPDKPAGRGLEIVQSPVKKFALEQNIPVLQPEVLNEHFIAELKKRNIDLLVVAAYGKILPSAVLDIGKVPPLNVHPSLLPKYRGTSPVESQILAGEEEVGVTIIQMDEKMDHGPIVAQEKVSVSKQSTRDELNRILWTRGGQILSEIIPSWIAGNKTPTPQDHSQATFTKKISKEDGEVSLSDDPVILDRKFRAYHPWPGLYFYTNRNGTRTRVKIKTARWENEQFIIETVIPENGKPMPFSAL